MRIICNRKEGLSWVRKIRIAKRYHYNDDAILDALYNEGDPAWKGWIIGALTLMTVVNTTDVALTGLSLAASIPMVVNVSLMLVNVMIALYNLWNIGVDSWLIAEHRLQNLVKVGVIAGVCYGLAIAAFVTLAAVTPGANLLLTTLFVANAVAIGIIVMNSVCNMILPWMQRKIREKYYAFKGKRPSPVRLSRYEESMLKENDGYSWTNCSDKTILQALRKKGLGKATKDKDLLCQTRRRLAVFFKAECRRRAERGPGSSMTQEDIIKEYALAQKQVIKHGKFWENTKPYDLYIARTMLHVSKIAYDLRRLFYLMQADEVYQQNKNQQSVDRLLKTITGKDSMQGESNVRIDKLNRAVELLKKEEFRDYKSVLNRYVIFNKTHTELPALLAELTSMAKSCVQKRFLKKLLKLHDSSSLSIDEIKSVLKVKLASMIRQEPALTGINEPKLIDEIMKPLRQELVLRDTCCPLETHRGCRG